MRKFISAVTSLCVAATMATAIAPATVSAADTSKTLSLMTWGEAYGEKSSDIKVDASTSDVTVPVGIYLTESTNDVEAMAIQCKVAVKGKTESEYTAAEQTALHGFTTKSYNSGDTYFATAHTYADSVWGSFDSTLPIYFHSKQNSRTKAVENMGSYQVAHATKQDSAYTAYAYYGMAWTEGTEAFPTDYTGTKSDDFPIAVFDVTIPAGTADGTYEVRFCNYNTDPDHLNPCTMLQTKDGRYQTDAETDDGMDLGDWTNNLNFETLTITVGDAASTTTTTTQAPVTTTTTTSQATPTTTTTKAPTGDVEVEVELVVDQTELDVTSAGASIWFDYIIKNSNGNRILSFDNNFKIVKVNADGSYTDVTDGSIAPVSCDKGDALTIGSWAPNATGFSVNGTTLEADGSGQLAKDGNSVFYFGIDVAQGAAAGTYRIVPNTKLVVLRQSQPAVQWVTNYDTDPDSVYAEFKIVGDEPVPTTTTTTTTTVTTTTTKVTTTTTTSAPVPTTTTTQPPTNPGDPLYGDTNCDNTVNVADVVLLNKWLNDNSSYAITAQGKLNADCYNPQGGADLTADDSDAIINSIVGNVTLPVNK